MQPADQITGCSCFCCCFVCVCACAFFLFQCVIFVFFFIFSSVEFDFVCEILKIIFVFARVASVMFLRRRPGAVPLAFRLRWEKTHTGGKTAYLREKSAFEAYD